MYVCMCVEEIVNLVESFKNRIYMTVVYEDLNICYSLCDFSFL